ncbi:MAG TPA: hypothetical protein VN816_02905 [Acidimicrobiales bacterium]|nr:hypothetical protein [Acidimicrobiales bacterium]
MTNTIEHLRRGWMSATTATRLWWSAVATVSLAGALLMGGVAVAAAVHHPAPKSTSTAMGDAMTGTARSGSGPSTPAPSMSGQSTPDQSMSGQSMSGPSTGAVSTSNAICPNVHGATVMANGMVMAPVPSTPPTAAQQAAAQSLVSAVTSDITQFANVQTAEADGYEPLSPPHGPMTHYLDRSVVEQGDVLDPAHPSALMFANTVDGPVLIGAMFLGPAPCQPGPDIGGSLTQWHAHDNLCVSGGQLVGKTNADGTCTIGDHRDTSYFMLHVWTAPQLAAQYQFQADLPPSAYTGIDQSGQS